MADLDSMLRQLSNETTAKTFKFNHDEAQFARDFQEKMSSTAHQREVEDLKLAGLNPVLSSGGSGAASYSASSASGSADSSVGAVANLYMTKMNNENARQIATQQNNIALANKRTDLKIAKINAAASKYASDQAASASRYASDNARYASIYGTDNTRYGVLNQFGQGLFGGDARSTGSKVGRGVADFAKNVTNGIRHIFGRH